MFRLFSVLIFFCLFSVESWSCDEEGLNYEKEKRLKRFSLSPYEEVVAAVNYVEDDGSEENPFTEHVDIDWKTILHVNEEELAAQKLRDAERQKEIDNVEKEILSKIHEFLTKHPTDQAALRSLHKKEREKLTSWASMAGAIGDYFEEQKRIGDADYFYDLAARGVEYSQNYGPSSQGRMHLALYNQEVSTKPKRPTSGLLVHIQKTIEAFCMTNGFDEVAEFAIRDLIKERNMLVRWHVSASGVSNDDYYGLNGLVTKVYVKNFVQGVLEKAQFLRPLQRAKRYDGSLKNTDLAKHLKDLGFCGVYQEYNQHNWVHPDGFVVRVKRIDNGAAQFTVGLTFVNPIVWTNDGKPQALGLHPNKKIIAFDEENEILKLAYDGNAPFVVPAFRFYYWHDKSQIDDMMKLAHFSLPDGFGKKVGPYSYDTKSVKNLLRFKKV